jgi:hypothetical protein
MVINTCKTHSLNALSFIEIFDETKQCQFWKVWRSPFWLSQSSSWIFEKYDPRLWKHASFISVTILVCIPLGSLQWKFTCMFWGLELLDNCLANVLRLQFISLICIFIWESTILCVNVIFSVPELKAAVSYFDQRFSIVHQSINLKHFLLPNE